MEASDPNPPGHAPLDPTDVIALVVLVIASLRRLDVKVTEPEHAPHVPVADFEAWRRQAESAYAWVVRASLLKIAINNLWFFGVRGAVSPQVLAMGGAIVFIGWVVAITIGWRRASAARRRQAELGIVVRGRRERQRAEPGSATGESADRPGGKA